MYLDFFALREPPFSITPDPRFVYLGEGHRDALAHLLFGIDQGGGGGFVQLTGEVGTGKTTLCRLLLEQLPAHARVALVLNPRQAPVELLETICEELGIDTEGRRGSSKALVDALNAFLLDAYGKGLRVVLVIDEAQDLSIEALEQVRLLTNLETDTQKLLQVILIGQPELRELLARDDLRQLAQRITARFHLVPLDEAGSERYLRHRHAVAGGTRLPFDKAAIRRLHRHSGGVPRLLNVLAERSLLAGYARDESGIGARLVDLAAREALPLRVRARRRWRDALLVLGAAGSLAALAWWLLPRRAVPDTPPATPPPATLVEDLPSAPPTMPQPAVQQPAVKQLDPPGFAEAIATAVDDAAWSSLLADWKLPASANDLAIARRCAPRLAEGVHCLRARGSLDQLVAIGRPVLLPLRAGTATAWSVLRGSGVHRVRLQLGDASFDVPRTLLRQSWNGDYVAIWRDGGDGAREVADIRTFQALHGLDADGIAGPQTRFAMAAEGPGPTLQELR
ncbi:MAG: peptidoglycan-binding protein [Lysobacteraceae bacterium]|nr:MAG: peptidoglycan-binding protein [Xanthomonadaceae bacterium]